uniref:Calmodulin n=1 Tax=Aureoumbra lagunensis TaxID=44058 RepID=A0A7S3NKC3_9STRA|mmetsp:Transcript_5555/g.8156  ORF Transcript_5555/g.8156 Transcript_5555/m.8156 type:complete len:956 (+) Transcript_5555:27-2894(+)|eukprot:CAMPEP_0197321428 /NCGR_PEP_ID=MMETSP0891-20130614/65144_1 /TAXON_ID=44058 ORGANISM="Aureoumbra lagunensis, Strain CCMP1510" /NCGR_SAMPLE_ID=MMETSP0891 /ASSEMBLY_ACC=CAM_ASM_000534 /LENGTH=955 /DNA_ID=CAMNT_0042813333 /DNA_START=25 /DNA_END=2892 /DNA_ORIENTATION=-
MIPESRRRGLRSKQTDLLEEEKLEAVLERARIEGACDLDKLELAALARYFWAYDENESGCLEASELAKLLHDMRGAYSEAEVQSILLRIDTSKNGFVEFSEFVRWWTGLTDDTNEENRESCFMRLLKKKNKCIHRKDEIADRIFLYIEQCEYKNEKAWRFSIECTNPIEALEFRLDLSESSGIRIEHRFDSTHSLNSCQAGCVARPFEITPVADLKANSTNFHMHYALSWRELENSPYIQSCISDVSKPNETILIVKEGEQSALTSWFPNILWRRPPDEATLFNGVEPEPSDVREGLLRSEWLAAAMAALAERPSLLKKCFQSMDGNFEIQLYLDGIQRCISIDDYLPCSQWSNRCVFGACASPRKIWVQILEKAIAKLFGSYTSLEFGHAVEGFALCTGLPCEAVRLADARVNANELWRKLQQWILQDHAIVSVATVGGDLSRIGETSDGRGYAVLDVSASSSNERLILLRDAWGYGFVPEALQEESTTSFWLTWEALLSRFEVLSACYPHVSESRAICRVILDINNGGCAGLELEISTKTELYLSVHQPQQRGTNAMCDLIDLGLLVMREDNVIGGVFPCLEACVSTDRLCHLTPGRYKLIAWTTALSQISATHNTKKISLSAAKRAATEIEARYRDLNTGHIDPETLAVALPDYCSSEPLAQWLIDHPEALINLGYDNEGCLCSQRSVVIVAHVSAGDVQLFNNTQWKASSDLETTIATAAKALGKPSPHPDHNFCIYTATNGGNGVSFAVENLAFNNFLHFTMDCSKANNALSHRGCLVASDSIAPGEVKLIHHLVPAGPGTWSWSYECEWTHTVDESDDENSPEAIMIGGQSSKEIDFAMLQSPAEESYQPGEISDDQNIVDLDDNSFDEDESLPQILDEIISFDGEEEEEVLDDSFDDDDNDASNSPEVSEEETIDNGDVLEIHNVVEEVEEYDTFSFDDYDIPEVPQP